MLHSSQFAVRHRLGLGLEDRVPDHKKQIRPAMVPSQERK